MGITLYNFCLMSTDGGFWRTVAAAVSSLQKKGRKKQLQGGLGGFLHFYACPMWTEAVIL